MQEPPIAKDGLALIERSQKRIRTLATRCAEAPASSPWAEAALAMLMVELHLDIVLENELVLPTFEAIAEDIHHREACEFRRNHLELQASLNAVALSGAAGVPLTGELWEKLLRTAVDHTESNEHLFLPVASRWLDREARMWLGDLWSTRRNELREEFDRRLG